MSLKNKLKYIGIDNVNAFILVRVLSSLAVFIVLMILSPYQFVIAPIFTILYYLLFGYILVDWKLKEVTLSYEYDSMEFFDAFLLFLKDGKPIKEALTKTCKVVFNDLSRLVQDKMGHKHNTVEEIINEIIDSMPSNYVSNMFLEVKEAYVNGNHLGDSIGMQLDFIKDKYNRNTVNYYRYIPVRIGVLCVIAMIFMVLVLVIST